MALTSMISSPPTSPPDTAATDTKPEGNGLPRSPRKVQFASTPDVHANGSLHPGHQSSPSPRTTAEQVPVQVSPFARAAHQPAPDMDHNDTRDTSTIMAARAVSWQDMYGRDLVSVREFEPSEAGGSDSSKGNWRESHKGCCSMM